jgi:hypothetical protein
LGVFGSFLVCYWLVIGSFLAVFGCFLVVSGALLGRYFVVILSLFCRYFVVFWVRLESFSSVIRVLNRRLLGVNKHLINTQKTL